jgi:hypothetical protein
LNNYSDGQYVRNPEPSEVHHRGREPVVRVVLIQEIKVEWAVGPDLRSAQVTCHYPQASRPADAVGLAVPVVRMIPSAKSDHKPVVDGRWSVAKTYTVILIEMFAIADVRCPQKRARRLY